MTYRDRLRRQLTGIYSLARKQRNLRLGLRALWLGAGGVILGWGINAIWGWLPNLVSWLLIGLFFASFPLAAILISRSSKSQWVWMVDRLFGLREQVSTAWEVVQKGQDGVLNDALVQDATVVLPKIHSRVSERGWFLRKELVSTLIVLLLGGVVLASLLIQPLSNLLGEPPAAITLPPTLPPFQKEIPADAQVPNQPAQETPQGESGQPGGNSPGDAQTQSSQSGENSDGSSNSDLGQVTDTLRDLGSQLSEQAGTYGLGQALENMDLNGSADALEDLNGQLDDLSLESLDNLAEAMRNAAGELGQAGEQNLSSDMEKAADALPETDAETNQALEQVAGDLRQLADALENSGEADAGTEGEQGAGTGSPEPLSRLAGEGGDFELPINDDPGSDLLNPAPSDAETGDELASGTQDTLRQPGDDIVQSPLLPNSFLWKWRDVVSQYFQR